MDQQPIIPRLTSKSTSMPKVPHNSYSSHNSTLISTKSQIKSQSQAHSQTQSHNSLPIYSHKQQILSLISQSHATLICGQTGSGKTTQVPQYLYYSSTQNQKYNKILVTQPRRISAVSLAERVAQQMGVNIGQEVGYNVRFQEKRSEKTRVCFMTDGMAIREMMVGNTFDVYIIDQAHQRSINTDVLLALLRERMIKNIQYNKQIQAQNNKKNKLIQKYNNYSLPPNRRPFKIVIMSATIQSQKFLTFFQTTSIVHISGRTFPTQIYHTLTPIQNYLQQIYNTVMQIHYSQKQQIITKNNQNGSIGGDILVFLTGQDQILMMAKKFNQVIKQYSINGLEVLMLYSALPHENQHKVFVRDQQNIRGLKRRIILATNIAQTSVTIPGLRYVIDAGFMKIRMFDSQRGIQMLATVPISKANALQRAGRAGRQRDGKCFRLYVKGDYDDLKQQTAPQILRSELTGPILQLKSIGIPSISSLKFLDQPPSQTISSSIFLLQRINCLTQQQSLTAYGNQISKIPLPPIFAHLLLQSYQLKCHQIMLDVLAVLGVESLFYVGKEVREQYAEQSHSNSRNRENSGSKGNKNNCVLEVMRKYVHVSGGMQVMSDHLAKGSLLREYIKSGDKKAFCKGNFVNRNNIKRAVQIREQLKDYLEQIVNQRSKKQFYSIVKPRQRAKSLQKDPKSTITSNPYKTPSSITAFLTCLLKHSPTHIATLNSTTVSSSTSSSTYTICDSGQQASIHPQSLLFYNKNKPKCIVFYQVVKTTKLYMRDCTAVDDVDHNNNSGGNQGIKGPIGNINGNGKYIGKNITNSGNLMANLWGTK